MKTIQDLLDETLDDELDLYENEEHQKAVEDLATHATKAIIDEIQNMGVDDLNVLIAIAEKLHEECLTIAYSNLDSIEKNINAWTDEVLSKPENQELTDTLH